MPKIIGWNFYEINSGPILIGWSEITYKKFSTHNIKNWGCQNCNSRFSHFSGDDVYMASCGNLTCNEYIIKYIIK